MTKIKQGKRKTKLIKGIQVVRGRKVDYDAIRRTANAYAMAAAWFSDFLNDEKLPTRDTVLAAIGRAYGCCCDAQRAYGKIFPADHTKGK